MLILISVTLIQGHSGLAEKKNQHQIILTTKYSIKLSTMVGQFFYMTLTLKT